MDKQNNTQKTNKSGPQICSASTEILLFQKNKKLYNKCDFSTSIRNSHTEYTSEIHAKHVKCIKKSILNENS